jgi:SAM-dependent methyltransferase
MFLSPSTPQHPAYAALLPSLKASGKFLDIGCYMGQDLRRLAHDGVPEANLIGADIVNHWDLGYEFFNDKDRFHAQYIESDLLHPNEARQRLFGQIDVVSLIHVLHQRDWDTQILACKEIVRFSKPGSVVIGYQGGTNDIAKRTKWNLENGQKEFTLHDPETLRNMWEIVSEDMGMKWSTQAEIVPWNELATRMEDVTYLGEDFALLGFLVTRVG